jgi:hypothetical protein
LSRASGLPVWCGCSVRKGTLMVVSSTGARYFSAARCALRSASSRDRPSPARPERTGMNPRQMPSFRSREEGGGLGARRGRDRGPASPGGKGTLS